MARTKATVRQMPRPNFIPPPGHRIGNKNIFNRRLRNAPFKIKTLLPERKLVELKSRKTENPFILLVREGDNVN